MGYLEGWQVRGLDLLLRLQGPQLPHDVVIVAIDNAAYDHLQRQPIPREYLARLIRGLQRSGAVAVALDVTLSTSTTPGAAAALARPLGEFSDGGLSRVVLASPLGATHGPLGAATLGRHVLSGSA